jgi:hypothetical protein
MYLKKNNFWIFFIDVFVHIKIVWSLLIFINYWSVVDDPVIHVCEICNITGSKSVESFDSVRVSALCATTQIHLSFKILIQTLFKNHENNIFIEETFMLINE